MRKHLLIMFSFYTDKELWLGIKENEHFMFKELYKRYVIQLYNAAYKIVKDEELAKDIVQDVFLNVYSKRHTLPDNLNPGAYLLTSIKNGCFNKLRDKKNQLKHIEFIKTNVDLHEESHGKATELKLYLNDKIKELPQKARTAFLLRYYDKKTNFEIAEKMGVSLRTIEKYLNNVFATFKKGE